MAISKKPQKKEQESEIDSLINKGGSVALLDKKDEKLVAPILLRLPPDDVTEIDSLISKRRIKIPRHTWLLEAVYEKMERDGK